MSEVASAGGAMVANRLRRNAARLKGWLTQQHIGCYRLYDADMPEYAAAVDVYTAEDGLRYAHVQEYQAPASIPPEKAARRLAELLEGVATALDIPAARIACKTRARAKGGGQYGRQAARDEWLVVREGAARLQINLWDYLDTGLFLDHRPVRLAIAGRSRNCRVLNLFCYTATASVHAALGGALASVSVDLSLTYLDWAARNFRLNGLDDARHRREHADVLRWLAASREQFDLIFCDPPTFSNSKRADDFDVQRDHARLLRLAMQRLAPAGTLIFSNNYRRFALDTAAVSAFARVAETTPRTIDRDFARNPGIHRVFELTHPVA
ncbi:MAG: class I SAM-dependent methyltransferase [Pseudomonadales bacterium]|nr:class I SAM-dependent methyltransferase [Pseudomonadales bacterium]MCP5183718.1 class I SAM-dependent methyltransferase [Pseudomonadales bacterium]